MSNEFMREARYVVLKSADVMKCLTVSELIELRRIQAKVEEHRAEIGKPPLDCVVVESDWPEYEQTWRAIEARSVPETWLERGLKELDAIRQNADRDDWQPNDENIVRRLYQAMVADGAQAAPSIPEAVMEVIAGLIYEVERNICPHEETHRGGQWEICDMCGARWADDMGGKPEFKWPEVVEKARDMLEAVRGLHQPAHRPSRSLPVLREEAMTTILENENGVRITEDDRRHGHYVAVGALCHCGEQLIVAPMIYHPEHRKGDPVMVCLDHGVHAYRFLDLVQGRQPRTET